VDTDPESRAILQGIVQMGRATALDVLAEGVETLGEFDTVVEAGVEMVQGYAVSRPVPPDLIPGLVANHTFRRRVA
jgi:EAL domain-containing protein (putative c-di-GMP-specific phosphodiesterase class I)